MFYNIIIPGTLVSRVIELGESPFRAMLCRKREFNNIKQDGVVDSLRHLIYSENYMKRDSNEHILTCLLTKAF